MLDSDQWYAGDASAIFAEYGVPIPSNIPSEFELEHEFAASLSVEDDIETVLQVMAGILQIEFWPESRAARYFVVSVAETIRNANLKNRIPTNLLELAYKMIEIVLEPLTNTVGIAEVELENLRDMIARNNEDV